MIKPDRANIGAQLRTVFGCFGIGVSVVCGCVLVLAMTGVLPALNEQFMHQSGIRWLSEGAVGGMLIAAAGFWRSD